MPLRDKKLMDGSKLLHLGLYMVVSASHRTNLSLAAALQSNEQSQQYLTLVVFTHSSCNSSPSSLFNGASQIERIQVSHEDLNRPHVYILLRIINATVLPAIASIRMTNGVTDKHTCSHIQRHACVVIVCDSSTG